MTIKEDTISSMFMRLFCDAPLGIDLTTIPDAHIVKHSFVTTMKQGSVVAASLANDSYGLVMMTRFGPIFMKTIKQRIWYYCATSFSEAASFKDFDAVSSIKPLQLKVEGGNIHFSYIKSEEMMSRIVSALAPEKQGA